MDILSASNNKTADLYRQDSLVKNLERTAQNADKGKDEKELMDACVEFESYFTNLLLKQMRATVDSDGGFIKKNQGERMFTEMLDEETSANIAKGGNGIGLAQALYEQMKRSTVGITYDEYLEKAQNLNEEPIVEVEA